MLVGVNISDYWMSEATSVLSCKVGKVPFVYLWLPIGGNPHRLLFLKPVFNCIKTRLSVWQSWFPSIGGRLVLLKSVLTALPVYALSFFKAPSCIWISEAASILSCKVGKVPFEYLGLPIGGNLRRLLFWKLVEYGGLEVRKLREFNIALLGWRMGAGVVPCGGKR
ncbi:hypothetical protein MTR_3g056685 [Medicago truncatula]|uniref:Uncharacterized protein n=1 Tax=Medicago truncatula TaxID=3880 RepID=A0A072UWM0_MEDTR|nr:hypothetical protein MTR_8g016530 [Medicago truncatula]KEH33997.1 hypothetical protein MTR_3g056685 [Medicago truncatula]